MPIFFTVAEGGKRGVHGWTDEKKERELQVEKGEPGLFVSGLTKVNMEGKIRRHMVTGRRGRVVKAQL